MEEMNKFLEYIKKKLGIKSESTGSESEEEIGNFSMNEGKADKVFGFRREIVKGVAVFFGTVLILALIFASSDGEETKKEAASLSVAKESEIADVKKPKNTLPNDYETLMAMNKAKEEEMRRQAEENAKNAAKKSNSRISKCSGNSTATSTCNSARAIQSITGSDTNAYIARRTFNK